MIDGWVGVITVQLRHATATLAFSQTTEVQTGFPSSGLTGSTVLCNLSKSASGSFLMASFIWEHET